jgi:hypothetical protein
LEDSTNSKQSATRDAVSEAIARSEVQRICGLLLQLPLQWGASLEGINPKAHLAKVTGISKSRIAEGSLDRLRPSRLKRAEDHSLRVARERAVEAGWTDKEFDQMVASAPQLSDGLPSQLGGLFHMWSMADGVPLEETTRQAIALEDFVVHLNVAASNDAWRDAQQAALDFLRSDEDPWPGAAHSRADWEAADSWQEIRRLADRLLMDGFEGLFVTLDAEWGAHYFAGLRPQPVLLGLAPHVALDADMKLPRRNGIRRPVRKLFELTFVIAERGYSGRWPDDPPGRSAVAAILEQSDAHAGNYFDGTRNLTLRTFEAWWLKLTADMRNRFGRTEQMAAPVMLARVALLWQNYWVKTESGKLRSIILLDRDEYRRRWQAMRRRLSTRFPEGQGDWPDWFTAQLSSAPSTGLPSPPSSGRSS